MINRKGSVHQTEIWDKLAPDVVRVLTDLGPLLECPSISQRRLPLLSLHTYARLYSLADSVVDIDARSMLNIHDYRAFASSPTR